MSDRAPYSRVYWSVMDDPKFDGIREDVKLFGSWSMLLIVADMAHPASAYIPRTVPTSAVKRLVDAGLVEVRDGHRFRIHGLDAERGRRADAARSGGKRDPNGTQPGPERLPRRDETRKEETSTARGTALGVPRGGPVVPFGEAMAAAGFAKPEGKAS